MAKVALGLALLCVVAVSFASESMGWVDELNNDSPIRQAQRERHSEREAAATAMDGVSLLESSARASSRGPAQNRITGAVKTFNPNDNMCVMCQFLVQRIQLDMAHFNVMGGFVGANTKGTGGAANAATGGAGASAKGDDFFFLQIAEGEEAEAEAEEEDEDEADEEDEETDEMEEADSNGDMEADWVAEDREVAVALEIEAKKQLAEEEGDINTLEALEIKSKAEDEEGTENERSAAPSTSLTETSAEVASGLSSEEQNEMEAVLRETRDDRVADSVEKQIEEGMAETPVMIEADSEDESDSEDMIDEEVTADMISNGQRKQLMGDLAKSFDKDLDLSNDEVADLVAMKEDKSADEFDGFTSPVYNADGHADAIEAGDVVEAEVPSTDNVFLQTAEEEEDETEEESDSGMADNIEFIELGHRPHIPRRYARVLHRAEKKPIAPVFAEMSGQHASFQSNGGLANVYRRGAPRPRGVGIANSPRRFRLADALSSRPRWNRFDPTVQPHPNAQRTKAREMWHRLMQMTYDRLEGYCSTRLPEQFTPFCRPLLRRFRVVAEGIRYGDRPNQVCMRTKFCPKGTYVRRSPHNVFKHVSSHRRAV